VAWYPPDQVGKTVVVPTEDDTWCEEQRHPSGPSSVCPERHARVYPAPLCGMIARIAASPFGPIFGSCRMSASHMRAISSRVSPRRLSWLPTRGGRSMNSEKADSATRVKVALRTSCATKRCAITEGCARGLGALGPQRSFSDATAMMRRIRPGVSLRSRAMDAMLCPLDRRCKICH